MIPVPSPVDGIRIEHDVRSGTWRLHAGDSTATVRAWTWGERRRLLHAVITSGVFDRARFVPGLLDLVVEGSLGGIDPDTIALTCLHLFGVPEHDPVMPLTRAELVAATTFGWTPQQLEAQRAADIDRLLGALSGPSADDGWTHIVVVPAATATGARLELMLRTVAQWAGVGEAGAGELSAATDGERGAAVRSGSPAPAASQASADAQADGAMQVSPQDEAPPFDRTIAGTARLRRRPATMRADALVDADLRSVAPVHSVPPEGTGNRDGSLLAAREGATLGARVIGAAAPANEADARRVRPVPIPHAEAHAETHAETDTAAPPSSPTAVGSSASPAIDERRGPQPLPAIARVKARSIAPGFDAARQEAQLPGGYAAAAIAAQSSDRGPARRLPAPPAPMLSTAARDADSPWSASWSATPPDARVPVSPKGERQPLGESDFFPTFRARVSWPDVATAATHERPARTDAPVVPADPFAASDLEERIADVLDRAAREGGIDLP